VYCTKCGVELPPDATVCPACAQQVRQFAPPEPVPNYLVQSILVTLCCCMPFGIVALVYSAQVSSKLAAGDVAGAQACSRNASKWSIIALVAGILSSAVLVGLSLWNNMGGSF
jgi:hypothetical protein